MGYEVIAGLQGLVVTSSPGTVLARLRAVLSPWLRERLLAFHKGRGPKKVTMISYCAPWPHTRPPGSSL